MIQAIAKALSRHVSASHKQWIKAQIGIAQRLWIRRFASYDALRLANMLREMGIAEGDTVLLHSAYRPTNGFLGTPQAIIEVVLNVIGRSGTLAMMSMPYTTSTKQYLGTGAVFDVRRTPSHMGIISEIFRRSGAKRSLSPTHPILAVGSKAEWLLAGHSECRYPCGPESPFERMLEAKGKLLFFDLPFVGFTFFHYIEHQIQGRLPFPLYEAAPMIARYVDYCGEIHQSEVFVFSEQAIAQRRVEVITDRMRREGTSHWRRIGKTQLVLATMANTLDTGLRLSNAGDLPYSLSRS